MSSVYVTTIDLNSIQSFAGELKSMIWKNADARWAVQARRTGNLWEEVGDISQAARNEDISLDDAALHLFDIYCEMLKEMTGVNYQWQGATK